MNIYCAGPIRGDTSYSSYYRSIIEIARQLGHVPLAELALRPEEISAADDETIYRRDTDWLKESQAMIAEVSGPSLGVGYEIAYALHIRKIPVLCLKHRSSKNLSAMIEGNSSELLRIESYGSQQELETKIGAFLYETTIILAHR